MDNVQVQRNGKDGADAVPAAVMRAAEPVDVVSQARADTLADYAILDTAPEETFDEVTRLVAQICEAPIALVSFVDRQRQFFKTASGFSGRGTDLELSICRHALLSDEPVMEIPDTHADPRTADNPLCHGEAAMRFYAGAPLRTAEGMAIGSLCVIDHRPRTLTPLQRDTLSVLARRLMAELDLKRSLRQQAVLQGEMDHRVKNSLQAVASFVRLQTAQVKDPGARHALDAVGKRVSSVALLHQELAGAGHGDTVELDRYMAKVSALFANSCPPNITVNAQFDPLIAPSDVATAVAAIANEFLTNSFKYAFPAGVAGMVTLRGTVTHNGYRVQLADDGIGRPRGSKAGLGTRIMEASAASLGARLSTKAVGTGHAVSFVIPSINAAVGSRSTVLAGTPPPLAASPSPPLREDEETEQPKQRPI